MPARHETPLLGIYARRAVEQFHDYSSVMPRRHTDAPETTSASGCLPMHPAANACHRSHIAYFQYLDVLHWLV